MGGMLRWQSCSTADFPLKRSKVAAACQPCRTKKMRCDGRQPCSRCTKDHRKCEYRPSTAISRSSNDGSNKAKHKSSHTSAAQSAPAPAASPRFQWSRLKKLSFHQDLYAALNLSTSPLSSKSGKLPPLLLEFYHLTAQPITIWTRMHMLFVKWCRLQKSSSLYSIRIPADVAKEAVHLFFKYNTLYTLFIDPSDIMTALDLDLFFPASTITSKSINAAGSLLLDTILALTFMAAGQTIGSDVLLDVARFFYDTVHQRWLTMTFPSFDINHSPATAMAKSSFKDNNNNDNNNNSNNNINSSSLKLLTQTAILLIHFQCSAICEDQAYMTSRIAQGCLERLLSIHQLKTDTHHQQQHDHTCLQYTLHAWQVWFALYLYGGQSLLCPNTSSFLVSPPSPPALPLSSSPLAKHQHQEQQLWTWKVLTQYTMFMESLLKSNQTRGITFQDMVDKSQSLATLSTMSKQPSSTFATCPEQLVGLYHSILTIQLFSTQWLPHLDFFTPALKAEQQPEHTDEGDEGTNVDDKSKVVGDGVDDNIVTSHGMDPAKELCIKTSQRIIQMVSTMMMTGQYITAHRSSSPLLLFIRYRALCFAAVILVPMGQQQLVDGGPLSTYLDDSLHQLKQILEKDIQIWPMARQYLYYLQQRMPSYFDIQETTTDEGLLSNYDGIDGGNSLVLDEQHGRSLATTPAMISYSPTSRTQQHQQRWHGLKKRDHIDQEQLNKLSLQHDQLSKFVTTGKRNGNQRNDDIICTQQLSEDAVYSRKRSRTYPTTTPTTDYWLSSDAVNGTNVGGPGSYLVLGNDDHSSMLLSASSSTESSTSVSTELSVPPATATATLKLSPSISTVSSAFTLSGTPSACSPIVPILSTTYPTPLHQQAICVSQSVMTAIPTAAISPTNNNDENCNDESFHLIQQTSLPTTSLSNYHQHQVMVQQQHQEQQAITAMAMAPTVSSTMADNDGLLPPYQSSFPIYKRPSTSWQYHPSPTRQLLHDTFTASIMETLHATHDHSVIHGPGETHHLPPAPTSSPIDTPTPSYLDDVHLQAVSRGLSHHASSIALTRTASVDSAPTTAQNNDLISNDRHTQAWLYFLYQQEQQQQRQQQNYQHLLPPPPPPSESSTSADDPFMLFSSSLPSIPRK
ncbi:hypothetical protein BCR42DRAFT_446461 [Absidia repens]|uniref:Zn(2)-C6 fungal-type domain-containing protein n=1 Tax=Absidia repens TaxID=90262 RepID=A0A1X2IZ06_9FUNG|nr:hypothetical protein BCR42DRAFT_446461 [Absidia repens]